jgi:hypothetical protein
MALPGLWWEEPNMASLLDAVFMANSQRFDTANRAPLLLIWFFAPNRRVSPPSRGASFFRLQRIKHIILSHLTQKSSKKSALPAKWTHP